MVRARARTHVSLYASFSSYTLTRASAQTLWEPSNRRTLGETRARAVVDRCPVLLPAALRRVSLFASYKKANAANSLARCEAAALKVQLHREESPRRKRRGREGGEGDEPPRQPSLARLSIADINEKKRHFRTPHRRVINLESAIPSARPLSLSLSTAAPIIIFSPVYALSAEMKLSHARIARSRSRSFFSGPFINWSV